MIKHGRRIHRSCRHLIALALASIPLLSTPRVEAASNDYFDWLASQPEAFVMRAYRSQAQIDGDIHAVQPQNRNRPPVYDAAVDAARWTLPRTYTGIDIADQVHVPFPATLTSGNLLATWDSAWDSRFQANLSTLETHKAFRFDGDEGRKPVVEVRTRFEYATGSNVAKIDSRIYGSWSPAGEIQNEALDNNFIVAGDTWTRFWVYLDFSAKTYSLWVADETRRPVLVVDRYQFSSMAEGLNLFRFEFNSSQENRSASQDLFIWSRNFAALRNVSNVNAIIAQGESVSGEDRIVPRAPESLTAR